MLSTNLFNSLLLPTVRLSTGIVEKNAPKILAVTAAGASIAACATTGVATWKSKDIIEECNARVKEMENEIDLMYEDPGASANDIEAMEKKIRNYKILTAAELACEYALPTMILGGSIAAGVGSTAIFSKRIATMAASYAALSAAYTKYRKRVADEIGVDKEDELFKGIREKEITYTDENGNTVTKKVKSYTDMPLGDFCVFWICGQNKFSQDDPARDLAFIESVEDYITRYINSDGYIYMDTIYKSVGIEVPDVPLGGDKAELVAQRWHTYGKIKSQDRINSYLQWCSDNGVEATEEGIVNANRFSFGISEQQKQDFLNGNTDGLLLLCPNIDGDIFTNGAFMSLKDEDVTIDENYFGVRPYE